MSIWAGVAAGITGTFAALTGAITGFFSATLLPFFVSIGQALMTFLSSLAAASSATVLGIPYAVAILAGVALIGAAIGTLAAFAFADGGIVTGPTMGMVGEAGSSEAVIPLCAGCRHDARGRPYHELWRRSGTPLRTTPVIGRHQSKDWCTILFWYRYAFYAS